MSSTSRGELYHPRWAAGGLRHDGHAHRHRASAGPDGQLHVQAAVGTGPVDAAYKAMDAIVQAPNTLLEFAVHAVTEGIDALGEVTVRIEGK